MMSNEVNIWYLTMKREIEDTIKTEDIKKFALGLLADLPPYFFEVAASSSGKYHPEVDLGVGGLVRHSINVMRMLTHILVIFKDEYKGTERDIELLKVAALFHDCMKSGNQEDYEKNPHTRFQHPILASAFILVESVGLNFSYDDAKKIADAIASHMGQWNTDDIGGVLPKPKTFDQKLINLADNLASRKGIEMAVEPILTITNHENS